VPHRHYYMACHTVYANVHHAAMWGAQIYAGCNCLTRACILKAMQGALRPQRRPLFRLCVSWGLAMGCCASGKLRWVVCRCGVVVMCRTYVHDRTRKCQRCEGSGGVFPSAVLCACHLIACTPAVWCFVCMSSDSAPAAVLVYAQKKLSPGSCSPAA
jgi:hypothetical protein